MSYIKKKKIYEWDGKEDLSNKTIEGDFRVKENVTSLKGCPKIVKGNFDCSKSKITTLEGAPEIIGGHLYCRNCENLISLEGAPKEVGEEFSCSYCGNLKSIKGISKKIGKRFFALNCNKLVVNDVPIKLGYNYDDMKGRLLMGINRFVSIDTIFLIKLSQVKWNYNRYLDPKILKKINLNQLEIYKKLFNNIDIDETLAKISITKKIFFK